MTLETTELKDFYQRMRFWHQNRTRQTDFFLIGIQKGGSSWLSVRLGELPGVQRSNPKEPMFFSYHWKEHFEDWSDSKLRSHYLKRYWPHPRGKVLFEATPGYMSDIKIAKRVRRVSPDAKFIVVLRNPTSRAFSAYQMWVRNHNHQLTFRETYKPILNRANDLIKQHGRTRTFYHALGYARPERLLTYGLYHLHLTQWFEVFDRSKFFVMTTPQLNDREKMGDLIAFLGFDRTDLSDLQLEAKVKTRHLGEPISNDDKMELDAFFEPFNQQLFDLLGGEKLAW